MNIKGDIMFKATTKDILSTILSENNVTFEQVKSKLIEEKNLEAKKWNSVKDIPRITAFEIIDRIQKKAKAKAS